MAIAAPSIISAVSRESGVWRVLKRTRIALFDRVSVTKMSAILRVTTKRAVLATLLDKVSMEPYRIDGESSTNSDVVDLHYDVLEANSSSQGIQAVADRLKEQEDDLRFLVDSDSTLLLDLGVSI